ncbi:Platelet-activating factor acetylhydrolase [Phytophthora pseudosyringae]|uniref:Platelet-activating factor acetylhydrolase n=1 Tax=Phytophthora pseudosyringae TaxID=221518 RepID=A0A8T1V6Z8_9STRA|nr:Platelet-activating factor acetylhydrolase [Phytophthora pseudosyringae]
MQHVRQQHPEYEAEMLAGTTAETGSLTHYVTSQNRYSTLDPICVETLVIVLDGVMLAVVRLIAADIPEHFGIILDGWSHASKH